MTNLEQEKRRRGLSLKAYRDVEGHWKIGYRTPSKEGETCTAAEAEQWLREELSHETVDPIDQLLMMLAWQEDYTDEFKRKCLLNAIEFATQKEPTK